MILTSTQNTKMNSELSVNQLSNLPYEEVIQYFEQKRNFPVNVGNVSVESYAQFLLKETILCDI
jgi:flavoprotein